MDHCQCQRFPKAACERPITQEDLLCDECRDGCAEVGLGSPASYSVIASHIEAPDWIRAR